MGFPVVWFKKDLRVRDHRPLVEAMKCGPVIGLFLVEPQWLDAPEFSPRHYQFAMDSVFELSASLHKLNVPLLVGVESAVDIFSLLHGTGAMEKLYSHQETGAFWTYQRDLEVKKWCLHHQVPWSEHLQFAVHRRLKNRDLWNQKRKKIIERSPLPTPRPQGLFSNEILSKILNKSAKSLFLCPQSAPSTPLSWISGKIKGKQSSFFSLPKSWEATPGGSKKAHETLESFLTVRGQYYQREMSSPLTAFDSCSRLSPHITWGTLSLSEIHQQLECAKEELSFGPPGFSQWSRSLRSFESRLWWHCHFIQKLESEPDIEFENMNQGFDGMRENQFSQDRFDAWKTGQTGFPFIDACMRALNQKGWINFRMRAMLISFASYQLWLHWRQTATHLARVFVDFEPGIHYSQVQMQSGVTGINTIRIYSPVKQSKDQDPDGEFIRKYCPELAALETPYIFEPYLAPPFILQLSGVRLGKTYPLPIVNPKESYQKAKSEIFKWKSKGCVRQMAKDVYRKHGSRKNKFFPSQKRG